MEAYKKFCRNSRKAVDLWRSRPALRLEQEPCTDGVSEVRHRSQEQIIRELLAMGPAVRFEGPNVLWGLLALAGWALADTFARVMAYSDHHEPVWKLFVIYIAWFITMASCAILGMANRGYIQKRTVSKLFLLLSILSLLRQLFPRGYLFNIFPPLSFLFVVPVVINWWALLTGILHTPDYDPLLDRARPWLGSYVADYIRAYTIAAFSTWYISTAVVIGLIAEFVVTYLAGAPLPFYQGPTISVPPPTVDLKLALTLWRNVLFITSVVPCLVLVVFLRANANLYTRKEYREALAEAEDPERAWEDMDTDDSEERPQITQV